MIAFPFNFNPIFQEVKTGLSVTTVPAGRYAMVTPMGSFMDIDSERIGFNPASYDFDTGGGSGPFVSSLMVNNSKQNLFVEVSIRSGGVSLGDYVAVYAGTIDDATRPIETLGAVVSGWEGVSGYRYVMHGNLGVTQSSHIFRLPPKATLRRQINHQQAGDVDVNIRVWAEKTVTGQYWVNAGTEIDGDLYHYAEFILPT